MSRLFNQAVRHASRAKFLGVAASACLIFASLSGGHALAAQKNMTKTGAAAESPLPEDPPLARDLPPRQVELVIVWGFRLRPTEHDLRMASVRSGYGELIDKAACTNSICGFVVVQDGAKWRNTNVIAGSEGELRDLQRNMEREGTTLVIVHPTGQKRAVPNF
jgi:hypothetical protein